MSIEPRPSPDCAGVRVLYVIDSLQPAGAEWSLLAMAPYLLAAGIQLEVAHFGSEEGLGPHFAALGVPVRRLHAHRGRLSRMWALRKLIRSTGPDLVHTTLFEADVSGRVAARLARVPVVSSLVSTAYGPVQRAAFGLPRWKVEAARALDALTARLVCRFHAISRVVAEEMAAVLHIAPERIDVVPRGRDAEALGRRDDARRARVRHELGVVDDAPMFLVASRQEPPKALNVAVDAFGSVVRRHPAAVLVLAGREGSATPALLEAIERSGVAGAVLQLGWRDDVPDLMAAADVFVFTSRWEGLGSVLIEAMALEVPIVASDLPVLRELLVDDDGTELAWFAPVADAHAFAAACAAALDDSGDRPQRARDRFLRHYTAEAAASGVMAIYRRALDA